MIQQVLVQGVELAHLQLLQSDAADSRQGVQAQLAAVLLPRGVRQRPSGRRQPLLLKEGGDGQQVRDHECSVGDLAQQSLTRIYRRRPRGESVVSSDGARPSAVGIWQEKYQVIGGWPQPHTFCPRGMRLWQRLYRR